MMPSNRSTFSFLESYERIANSIGWTLIHFLWQALLIAAATALLLKLLRHCSANGHYAVACGGLCTMALAPLLTFASINGTPGFSWSSESDHFEVAADDNLLSKPETVVAESSMATLRPPTDPTPNLNPAMDFERYRTVPPARSENSWLQNIFGLVRGSLGKLAPWIAGIWLIGVLLAATRLFFGWKTLDLLRTEALIGDHPQLARHLSSLKQKLGVAGQVSIGLSRSVANPLVTGWFRPLILLPAKIVDDLSPLQIKAVLAHELAHIRRGDFAINVVQCIIETLLFFHPCVWWASGKVRQERENCCDDMAANVLGSRKAYAEALLCLEQTRTRNQRLAMGAKGGSFLERIRRLTQSRHQSSFRPGIRVAPTVIGLCFLLPLLPGLVVIATAAMQGQEQETEKDPMILNQQIAITVVDAEGKPVPKVNIHTGVWSGDGSVEDIAFPPNRNYVTDKDGRANVELPHNYYIVRLWITGDGFVPMFTGWEEKQIVDGDTPPESLTVTAIRGIRGGGTVIDANGKPVAGAEVSLSGSGGAEQKGRVRFLGGYGTVETDEKGKWTFNNLNPDPGTSFKASVKHNGYLPGESSIDRKPLLAGDAQISLSQGIQLTGKITDADGNIVSDGLVIWGDDPYFEAGSQEVEIDAKGNYQSLPLLPAKQKRITVLAKGHCPASKIVDILPGMPPVDFQLQRGHKLRIKITDSDGIPLAGAYLTPRKWRGAQSLYSYVHPNVKPTGIPIRANDNGIFEWDWAPVDEVYWTVGVRGFLQSDEIPLIAGDQVHVIRLTRKPIVAGVVRYADTGKPARFTKVTPIFQGEPESIASRRDPDSVVADANGEFALEVTRNGYIYRLEFSKKGYRRFLSEPFDALTPPENLTVELKKSNPVTGTVVDHAGQAVANADVYLVNKFNKLDLDSYHTHARVPNAKSDKSGNFEFETIVDATTLVLIHARGYAEVLIPDSKESKPNQPGPRIELKPWASVKGKVMVNGEPVRNAHIQFQPLTQGPMIFNQIHSIIRSKTNDKGEFQFLKVGPQQGSISVYKRSTNDKESSHRIRIPFQATPGESCSLNIDLNYLVETKIAEVDLLKNADFGDSYCAFVKIDDWESKLPAEIAAANPHAGNYLETLKHLETKKDFKSSILLENSQESTNGTLDKNGRIKAYLPGPGNYHFTFHLNGRPHVDTADASVSPLIRHQSIVEIREGNHQLPPIKISFQQPAAIGDSVAEIDFQSGEECLSFSDYNGKVILVDFWCPWSKHTKACNRSIAALKSAVQVDDPLAILSLQCGAQNQSKVKRQFPDELKPYVRSMILSYDESAAICPKFSAWNVPLAVVIDQQGKLRFTGSHEDAVALVRELLEAN